MIYFLSIQMFLIFLVHIFQDVYLVGPIVLVFSIMFSIYFAFSPDKSY